MNVPKLQHYVPRFYLRRFATPDDQIWVYDKERERMWCTNIDNAASETHLYSVTLEDGTRITAIEEMLARIESVAAPILERFLQGQRIVDQERADMASFIALQFVRTNAFRRQYAEVAMQMTQSILYSMARNERAFEAQMRKYEKEHGSLSLDEKRSLREGMLDPTKFKISVSRDWTLRALTIHDALEPVIFRMNWSVIHLRGQHELITGDNPVVQGITEGQHSHIHAGGFMHRATEVVLPLSPKALWLGHWKNNVPAIGVAPSRIAKDLNRVQAAVAERYLFAAKQDSGLLALVRKYRDHRPKWEVSGFGPKTFSSVSISRH